MTDSGMEEWRRRIDAGERAVAGLPGAGQSLADQADLLAEDPQLLMTPADARAMSYFLALLRELGPAASRSYALAVDAVRMWVENGSVPPAYQCAVYSRIGTVLAESGSGAVAFMALRAAVNAAVSPSEEAYALARLGELEIHYQQPSHARVHAERAARLVPQAEDSVTWLDVRMRSAYTLLRVEYQSSLVRELVDVCGRQIDRWGNDHPRALEALTIMAVAQREHAQKQGDRAAAERYTDVLAVTAQRSASLLGARHPQARAARAALTEDHRVSQGARVRQGEHARATSLPHRGADDLQPWPDDEGRATEPRRSPVTTVAGDGSARAGDLRELVARARLVLWAFDGPVCRLFAGRSADTAMDNLVRWLETRGLDSLPRREEWQASGDPHAVLRAVADRWPSSDLVLELEARLTQEELRAVSTALPTAYADPLIRTWTALGVQQAIATNVSPQGAYTYLAGRGLISCFAPHIYGRTRDLGLLKPDPSSVYRALNAMGTPAASVVMIGGTPTNYRAARQAGIPFLGYAQNDHRAKDLRDAGVELIVESLEQVLSVLRPRSPS
ncbi:HAD family hydrolase [Streptomyces sp. NPDC088360]|uniref:HAD family hydrolase n=1 Tax=Streptomyces sp. NPDC088360 TaxID=3154515 RepID=UPI00344F6C6B